MPLLSHDLSLPFSHLQIATKINHIHQIPHHRIFLFVEETRFPAAIAEKSIWYGTNDSELIFVFCYCVRLLLRSQGQRLLLLCFVLVTSRSLIKLSEFGSFFFLISSRRAKAFKLC